MAMIMIKCPAMGRPIPTGMAADQESFETGTFSQKRVWCSHCGHVHVWDKKDAWLQD